jgi:lipoprotein-releasing system permease protein
LSVMNGFQKELRARILGVASHVQISGVDNTLSNWPAIAADAKQQKNVVAAAPYVMAQAMLSFDSNVQGAIIRGIEPKLEDQVADIGAHMKDGKLTNLKQGEFGIVLGSELARALRAFPGDKVVLISPQGQVTPAGIVPRLKQFTLVGIFEVGMFEYDNGLALIHLADAQKLYRMNDKVSGVRLKLDDLFEAPKVARDLTTMISADAYITDWTRSHANFFRAVQIEKNVMFVILLLIVAVAAFNIVSTLVMVVTDKQSDIAILRTLGAAPKSIMQIFMVQGSLIGLFGTLIGVVGGVLLAKNIDVVVPAIERVFGVAFLDKSVYYISELPSELLWRDVGVIALVSFVLTLLATIYPSWSASRIKPADALRYE